MPSSLATEARAWGRAELEIEHGWEAAPAPPDSRSQPSKLDDLGWIPARVPGTAAGALRDAGLWRPSAPRDLDAEDWWFRVAFDAPAAGPGEEVRLEVGGIASVAEVHLNGELVLETESMFLEHSVDVGSALRGENELAIRCRALAPMLRQRRKPRARWRTALVKDGNLRFFRTMLIGRAPGFAPAPAAVGPWRPVRLARTLGLAIEDVRLRPRLDGDEGVLVVVARLRDLDGEGLERVAVELEGPSGSHRTELSLTPADGGFEAAGELRIPGVATWWPHTHGEPALHEVRLVAGRSAGEVRLEAGRVGFRTVAPGPQSGHDVEAEGIDLHLNGVRVFARGAVWTPVDPLGLAPDGPELRATLELARDAGMNMVRVPGTSAYEAPAFHDLCDELGILVWQDLMFANMDYPFADDGFRELVTREALQVLAGLARRPSLAVICGNSEVEQQAAMLGLEPGLGRGEFFGETLPSLAREVGVDAPYVPSAPCGGDLPFRTDGGIANYYGVGAYRRPLEDARRAGVRFAAECLAFANVPDPSTIEALAPESATPVAVHDPRWKAAVPRDVGAGWDFDDVRDHYLEALYGVDAAELRSDEPERYLDLSRAVTGEVMSEVYGEWRRAGSPCGGGLLLWLRDLVPGAGWGVIDSLGIPKAALGHLRRALAPVAVWTTDEGLGGVVVHVANERPAPVTARIRVALYRNLEQRVDEAAEEVEVPAHGAVVRNVEALFGRFVDAAWAYRFGPPPQDLIVVSLEREDGGPDPISVAARFPAGRPSGAEPAVSLGLEARAVTADGGAVKVVLRSRRAAWGVRLRAEGFAPDDDAFVLEPGVERSVAMWPAGGDAEFSGGAVTALNLEGRVRVALDEATV